jgi:hypothetical protein
LTGLLPTFSAGQAANKTEGSKRAARAISRLIRAVEHLMNSDPIKNEGKS